MEKKQRFNIMDALQKVLLLSDDCTMFDPESKSRERMLEIAKKLKELHVVVYSKKKDNGKKEKIADNMWIYPTSSSLSLFQPFDAWNIIQQQIVWKHALWTNIIVSESPLKTAFLSYTISKLYKARLAVFLETTDMYDLYTRKNSGTWLAKKVFTLLSDYFFARALSIRASSEKTAALLESLYPGTKKRIFIIPSFKPSTIEKTDVSLIKKESVSIRTSYPQFNIIILSVCDFYSRQDLRKTFEIFSLLLRRYPLAGLIISGKEKPKKFDKLVREFKTENSVVFDSRIEHLPMYYSTANIFLIVSKDERNSALIINAATVGSVIVTSDLISARDIITDGESGKICASQTAEAFAQSIVSTLEVAGTADLFRITIKEEMKDIFAENMEQYSIYYKYFLRNVYAKDEEI